MYLYNVKNTQFVSDHIESKPFHASATLYAMLNISKPFAWRSQRQSGNIEQHVQICKSFNQSENDTTFL